MNELCIGLARSTRETAREVAGMYVDEAHTEDRVGDDRSGELQGASHGGAPDDPKGRPRVRRKGERKRLQREIRRARTRRSVVDCKNADGRFGKSCRPRVAKAQRRRRRCVSGVVEFARRGGEMKPGRV